MPIIINEFEIEVEPQKQSSNGGGAQQPAQQSPKARPQEVTSVVRLQQERTERVRAD